MHQTVSFWTVPQINEGFSEDGRVPFMDKIHNGDDVKREEESGILGPDYVQLLEELFGLLYGEDGPDSTLVDDQAVSIGESQIIE